MRVRRDSRLSFGETFGSYASVWSARYVHLSRSPGRATQSNLVTRADDTLTEAVGAFIGGLVRGSARNESASVNPARIGGSRSVHRTNLC